MKRRILSFITAIISYLTAAAFVCTAIIFIIRFSAVLDFNNYALKNTFGFDLLKSAGINAFIAIMGILLSFALCFFKILTGYYYIKISGGDKLFFMKQEKSTIGFCILAAIMAAAFISLSAGIKSLKPYLFATLTFAALYCLQAILPIAEIIVFEARDKKERNANRNFPSTVPTEENIKNELERESEAEQQGAE